MESLPWNEADRENFQILVDPTKAPRVVEGRPLGVLSSLAARYSRDILSNPFGFAPLSTVLDEDSLEPIRKLIGDLSELGETTEERYTSYMKHVRANPYYKWLADNLHFKTAHQFFSKRQRDKRDGNPYGIEWAEFQFLSIAAMLGFFVRAQKENYRPRVASSRMRQQALTRAKALKQSLAQGVRFTLELNQENLSVLLGRFIDELGTTSYVKPREDSTLLGRKFVTLVTQLLLRKFSEASPTLVTNFAAVMGYMPDQTAIERQIKKARMEWRKNHIKLVAAALMRS